MIFTYRKVLKSMNSIADIFVIEYFVICHDYKTLCIQHVKQSRALEGFDEPLRNIQFFWNVKPCVLVPASSGSFALSDPADVSTILLRNVCYYLSVDAA